MIDTIDKICIILIKGKGLKLMILEIREHDYRNRGY